MRSADIAIYEAPDGIRYRAALVRVDMRGGGVNLFQQASVVEVLDIGPHVHEDYLEWVRDSGGRSRWNEAKRTVKVKLVEPEIPYVGKPGDVRFCTPREVLITQEEYVRLVRERDQRQAEYRAEVERKTTANTARAEELNRLQIEAGFTYGISTDMPAIEFSVSQSGDLMRSIRGDVVELVRAACAAKREETPA